MKLVNKCHQGGLWDFCGMPMGYLWDVSALPVGYFMICGMDRMYLGCLSDVCGKSVEYMWNICGMSAGCMWDMRGISMGCLWDVCRITFHIICYFGVLLARFPHNLSWVILQEHAAIH